MLPASPPVLCEGFLLLPLLVLFSPGPGGCSSPLWDANRGVPCTVPSSSLPGEVPSSLPAPDHSGERPGSMPVADHHGEGPGSRPGPGCAGEHPGCRPGPGRAGEHPGCRPAPGLLRAVRSPMPCPDLLCRMRSGLLHRNSLRGMPRPNLCTLPGSPACPEVCGVPLGGPDSRKILHPVPVPGLLRPGLLRRLRPPASVPAFVPHVCTPMPEPGLLRGLPHAASG